jgi:hypothetical protein
MNAERSLQGQKRKRSFPLIGIGIIEGRKISSKVFLVGRTSMRQQQSEVVVHAASECKSERKTNDVKSAKKKQQLMIGF